MVQKSGRFRPATAITSSRSWQARAICRLALLALADADDRRKVRGLPHTMRQMAGRHEFMHRRRQKPCLVQVPGAEGLAHAPQGIKARQDRLAMSRTGSQVLASVGDGGVLIAADRTDRADAMVPAVMMAERCHPSAWSDAEWRCRSCCSPCQAGSQVPEIVTARQREGHPYMAPGRAPAGGCCAICRTSGARPMRQRPNPGSMQAWARCPPPPPGRRGPPECARHTAMNTAGVACCRMEKSHPQFCGDGQRAPIEGLVAMIGAMHRICSKIVCLPCSTAESPSSRITKLSGSRSSLPWTAVVSRRSALIARKRSMMSTEVGLSMCSSSTPSCRARMGSVSAVG